MAAKKTATKITKLAPPEAAATPKPAAKKAAAPASKLAPENNPAPAPAKPAKKAVAKKAPAAPVTTAPAAKKAAAKPSLDAVARAAYLNYRRRVEQGLPGDSHGDWLEAERQFSQAG